MKEKSVLDGKKQLFKLLRASTWTVGGGVSHSFKGDIWLPYLLSSAVTNLYADY